MARVVVQRVAGRRLEVRAGDAVAIIDKSVADGGAGDGFRSVELLLGALGSCTIGTMLSAAEEAGIELGDVRADLTAITSLTTDTVTRAKLTLTVEGDLTPEETALLEAAAAHCKVHRSLHDGIETQFALRAEPTTGETQR
jgi:uncharacterized OsmC-like protein